MTDDSVPDSKERLRRPGRRWKREIVTARQSQSSRRAKVVIALGKALAGRDSRSRKVSQSYHAAVTPGTLGRLPPFSFEWTVLRSLLETSDRIQASDSGYA